MTARIPRDRWARELERFTTRNAGRWAILEVDDPDIGAQRILDSRLWGVDFEAAGGRVDLLFGAFDGSQEHLTHSIERPETIETMVDEAGRDAALRIGHKGGQTLLLFADARAAE